MENTQALKKRVKLSKELILAVVQVLIFTGAIIFAIIKFFDTLYPSSQAILIIIESFIGILVALLPVLVYKIFKIKMSFGIIMVIDTFAVLAIIGGEVLQLYYKTSWWDSALHAFSGGGIAFAIYCLFDFLTRDSNLKNKFAICLIAAICASLAIGLIWEAIEFTIDSFFGTNMQKFMPKSEPFFNGGFTHDNLFGTDEEIAAFFKTPEGYRYGLMDTMTDILYCFAGTVLFAVACALTAKKLKNFYSAMFIKTGKNAKESNLIDKDFEPNGLNEFNSLETAHMPDEDSASGNK